MQNLKQYLSYAKDLELSLFNQWNWHLRLKDEMEALKNPTLHQAIAVPENVSVIGLIFGTIGGGIGYGILGFIASFVFSILRGIAHYFGSPFDYVSVFDSKITYVVVIGCVLVGALNSACKRFEAMGNHQNAIQYNKNLEIENEKIKKESAQKLKIVENEHQKVIDKMRETQDLLEDYYSENIIYDKYRALVPVCTFYEYIASGRCSQLEGHEGAYNLYENELRLNIIVDKLDDIIDRLDTIASSQSAILNAINESTARLDSLEASAIASLNKLESLEQNTEALNYYSKVNTINNACQTFLLNDIRKNTAN